MNLPIHAPHRATERSDTTNSVRPPFSVHPLAADSAAAPSVQALFEYIVVLERRIEALEAGQPLPFSAAAPTGRPSGSSGSSADALLTREDVALRLQVSLRYVDQLVAGGTLVPIRIGRNVRFHSGVIDAFVRTSARQSRPIGFRSPSSSGPMGEAQRASTSRRTGARSGAQSASGMGTKEVAK